MNNLPILSLKVIIDHLEINDRLRCRNVCTQWRTLIDYYYAFDCLVISKKFGKSRFLEKWCDTNAALDLKNLLFKSDLDLILSRTFDGLVERVQSLSLCELEICDIAKILGKLNKIERLSINSRLSCYHPDPSYGRMRTFFIRSSTLKLISLGCEILVDQVIIDCPKLKRIKSGAYTSLIEYAHPHSIEFCEIENCKIEYAEQFTNLKYLFFKYFATDKINADFLSKLPNIEEIHLDCSDYFQLFDKLQDQKIKYNRKNLTIFLFGLSLSSSKDYGECTNFLDNNHVKLCIENYSKINYQFLMENFIDFDGIMSNWRLLPLDFLDKFPRLDCISLYEEIENEDIFIQLIQLITRSLAKPINMHLYVRIDKISKELLIRLSSICPVVTISTYYFSSTSLSQIDKLIGFSETLKVFNCKHIITKEMAIEIFTKLKNLFCLNFFMNCVEYHIFKCNENHYLLQRLTEKIAHFKSIDFIFAYFIQPGRAILDEWLAVDQ